MADAIPKRAIKVKIRKPEPPSESPCQYIYHWDRIIGALSALLLAIGLLGYGLYTWLSPSLPPTSVEIDKPRAQEEILPGTAQQPEDTVQEPMPPPSQPVPSAVTAAEEAATDLPAPRIGNTSVTASDSARSPVQPEPLSESPPQRAAEKALEVETPPPAGTDSPPSKIADEEHLQPEDGDEIAISEQQQLPARDEPPEPATVKTPAVESGEEEQEIMGQALTSENPPESSASDAPGPSVAVGAEPVSERETGATLAAPDPLKEQSDQGTLQLGETSIASPAVKRFLLAQSIAGNEPDGSLDDVTVNARGFAEVSSFSEVIDLEGEVLQYRWLHEGKEVLRIRVPVDAQRWRSHSTKRIYARMKGAWRAELRDSAGTLLASTDFVF